MAKKQSTTVTRISATEPSKKPKAITKVARGSREATSGGFHPLRATLDYFKGAWVELRQVHWPTRSATWGLTGAVLLFSAFFVVFITLLDGGFKFLFEQILK